MKILRWLMIGMSVVGGRALVCMPAAAAADTSDTWSSRPLPAVRARISAMAIAPMRASKNAVYLGDDSGSIIEYRWDRRGWQASRVADLGSGIGALIGAPASGSAGDALVFRTAAGAIQELRISKDGEWLRSELPFRTPAGMGASPGGSRSADLLGGRLGTLPWSLYTAAHDGKRSVDAILREDGRWEAASLGIRKPLTGGCEAPFQAARILGFGAGRGDGVQRAYVHFDEGSYPYPCTVFENLAGLWEASWDGQAIKRRRILSEDVRGLGVGGARPDGRQRIYACTTRRLVELDYGPGGRYRETELSLDGAPCTTVAIGRPAGQAGPALFAASETGAVTAYTWEEGGWRSARVADLGSPAFALFSADARNDGKTRLYAATRNAVTELCPSSGLCSPGDHDPPSSPKELSVAVGPEQGAVVSWAPSRDSGPGATGVSHYVLERCPGLECTSFRRVARPRGLEYVDVEADTSGVLRYRVRAVDRVGNASAPSEPSFLVPEEIPKGVESDSEAEDETWAGLTGRGWLIAAFAFLLVILLIIRAFKARRATRSPDGNEGGLQGEGALKTLALKVGTVIGDRFKILGRRGPDGRFEPDKLGGGGYGVVVKVEDLASHEEPKQIGALKLLSAALASPPDSQVRERGMLFLKEPEVLKALRHENIVRVIDSGLWRATVPFICYEYIEGESLWERLHDADSRLRPMPWEELSRFLPGVCEALGYLHGLGISHQDVRPANIMIRRKDGRPILTDFGLARRFDKAVPLVPEVSGITRPLVPAGAMDPYWGPENRPGRRADIYSLAMTVLVALTGIDPGKEEEVSAALNAGDGAGGPEMRGLVGVFAVLRKALDHDPDKRPPSVRALSDELLRAAPVATGATGEKP